MRRATSRVTIDRVAIRNIAQAQIRALEKTAEALHTEVVQAQVVPFGEGTLQNESFFVDYSRSNNGIVTLVFSTPYARRLYFHPEYNYSKEENIHAGGKWLQHWIDGDNKDFVVNTYKQFFRRESGV
ncbi:MAG: hypothetical protein Q4F05_11245 [bacterium]|nr:hypothetical protein [bacterium]